MTKTEQVDYFADAETPNRFYLPDGVSFIEHKKLDEGTFQRYQDLTSAVKIGRDGETTEIDMKLGAQREFLFNNLVTGWNLVKESKPFTFTHSALRNLPPHLLGGLVEDIYKNNPILSGEDSEDAKSEEGKVEKKS